MQTLGTAGRAQEGPVEGVGISMQLRAEYPVLSPSWIQPFADQIWAVGCQVLLYKCCNMVENSLCQS